MRHSNEVIQSTHCAALALRALYGAKLLAGWLLGVQLGGCSSTPAQAAAVVEPGPALVLQTPPSCPRLARGNRMWTGFKEDVPIEHMHLALDVIRPLQERLGEVFCAPEHAACRPLHLSSIVLADVIPSSARVTLAGGAAAPGLSLELDMLYVRERWEPEPVGLAAVLAPCVKKAP